MSKAYHNSNLYNAPQNLPINFEVESTSTVKNQNPDQGKYNDTVLESLAFSCSSFPATESCCHQKGNTFSMNGTYSSQDK